MTLPYETQREIELFLLREAKLLDTGEFEAWLALYAPDGIYWMPSQPGQTDAKGVASIIYEDYAILAIRVRRLLEARALVLTPMPRTTRLRQQYRSDKGRRRRVLRGSGLYVHRAPGRPAAALFRPPYPSAGSAQRLVSHYT